MRPFPPAQGLHSPAPPPPSAPSPAPRRRTVLACALTAAGTTALTSGCGNGGDVEVSGTVLGETSEVPVGGGKIFADEKVVVTQPAAGDFKAFSAVCTHQGCTVGSVTNGLINCPCHGSRFRIADASVAAGPAPRPLPPREITVSDGTIRLA
ncbi:Rieske (2Fe-2S) protein [Streptomyces sp. MUM 203J]|uniref:Rieske (2Fe-2S) protein n=1 Tax=Streptomyces sp. MUM 203J TaxID=2791990 RepID=UPI001F04DF2B|nr:Rieske (2Fe-2S) protein [Streptomyces sp. MUM 203J]MCH0543247.1 Rieske (2Fe-2S) protein [Streptomyces sp. MUM 203J]